MDLTTDFQSQQDNTTRRSLSRRVSFAAHCRVRVFQEPNDNTNSTGTPPSSPTPPPDASPKEPQFNDENDYPGARPNVRRSSLRYSMGPSGMDMDLTSVGPNLDGSALMDEEFEGGSMDEDGTDLIDNILRRRRSSVATGLSMQPPGDDDTSHTEEPDTSEDPERSIEQDMEFTIPINRSLRPAQQDDAWLALRRMTHSGSHEPAEDTEMSEQSISFNYGEREDSVQDNDTSREMDDGDHTINITKLLGWPSRTEDVSHISVGDESNMEESDVYGPAAPAPTSLPQVSTPQSPVQDPHPEQSLLSSRPPVFQPPSADALSRSQTNATQDIFPRSDSEPFMFTAPQPVNTRTGSPSKIPVFKPTFTAAFAPPVSKPSPKKRAAEASSSNSTSPSKRPRSVDDDGEGNMSMDVPSPAKRQAMASRWPASGSTPTRPQTSPTTSSLPKPKPLSPSKKTPFQASTTRTNSLRRPSGYFARRKSLAAGSTSQPENDASGSAVQATAGAKSGLGFRRASVGSGSADAWQNFDKGNLPVQGTIPGSQSTARESNEDDTVNRPASPPGAENPSNTRSPTDPQSQAQSSIPNATSTSPTPPRATEPGASVDLSNFLHSTADDDAEREPPAMANDDQGDETDRWRDALDTGNPANEETVRSCQTVIFHRNITHCFP